MGEAKRRNATGEPSVRTDPYLVRVECEERKWLYGYIRTSDMDRVKRLGAEAMRQAVGLGLTPSSTVTAAKLHTPSIIASVEGALRKDPAAAKKMDEAPNSFFIIFGPLDKPLHAAA